MRRMRVVRPSRRKLAQQVPAVDTPLLREFIRDPRAIAAVMPSSVAMAMVLGVPIPESGEPWL